MERLVLHPHLEQRRRLADAYSWRDGEALDAPCELYDLGRTLRVRPRRPHLGQPESFAQFNGHPERGVLCPLCTNDRSSWLQCVVRKRKHRTRWNVRRPSCRSRTRVSSAESPDAAPSTDDNVGHDTYCIHTWPGCRPQQATLGICKGLDPTNYMGRLHLLRLL